MMRVSVVTEDGSGEGRGFPPTSYTCDKASLWGIDDGSSKACIGSSELSDRVSHKMAYPCYNLQRLGGDIHAFVVKTVLQDATDTLWCFHTSLHSGQLSSLLLLSTRANQWLDQELYWGVRKRPVQIQELHGGWISSSLPFTRVLLTK